MTGYFALDWILMVVSLSNTILLLWLGLTVLLNAESRTWGMYLAGSALLLGGLFFLSHSAILGYSPNLTLSSLNLWWQIGWLPLTCLPFAWYAVMLWYGGFWADTQSILRRRHKLWFAVTLLAALSFLLLIAFTHSLPSVAQLLAFDMTTTPALFGRPVLLLFYPLYTVLCTGLSLDVLWQPGPSARPYAEVARQRARPWLGAASLALFVVSLLVGGTVFWVVLAARQTSYDRGMVLGIGGLDLLISGLIGLAILFVGQAVVSYEIFTGKILPRRGLQRQWQRVILLAGGYSLAVSLAVLLSFRPINILLVATLLLGVFYALLSWRSFEERERFMESLRPFITPQGLYDELVSKPGQVDGAALQLKTGRAAFFALCSDVLGTRLAYLAPQGALALLAGPPLTYPASGVKTPSFPQGALPHDVDVETTWLAVDPATHGGAAWAIPLRDRSGLVGALLLGEKIGGSMYTLEEVELARLASERILDALASAEMARRLMGIQRQRLTESQVLDRQARRILHDDILPHLHAVTLRLSSKNATENQSDVLEELSALHSKISTLLRELPPASTPEIMQLGLEGALRHLVVEEYQPQFDRIGWEATPEACQFMADLPALSAEVIYYAVREAVRNAARHGRGAEADMKLSLSVRAVLGNDLKISVEDDGVGLPEERNPLKNMDIAREPGNSLAASSGQGLALHSTLLAVLGGKLEVDSLPGGSTTVTISLPVEVTP